MTTKHKNQKNNLVAQILHLEEEFKLIGETLKELDLGGDIAVKEINYLGDCVEKRVADADKVMDELYDLANDVKKYNEKPEFDADDPHRQTIEVQG